MRVSKHWKLIGIVSAMLVVCGWAATNWKRLAPYHWQTFQSSDARFSIEFPGNPVASQIDSSSQDGRQFVTHRLTATPVSGVIYALSWWENPGQSSESTDTVLANARQCGVSIFRPKIVAGRQLNQQGHAASETELLSENGVVSNRVVRVAPRMYSLWVIDSNGYFDRRNINRFFDSFVIH